MHNKSKEQWNKEQSELYKDPRWQKKRLEIFQRDKFTCQFCQSKTKTLVVHHLKYKDNLPPWEYDSDYLVCICEDCHNRESGQRKIYEKVLLSTLKINKFSCEDMHEMIIMFRNLNKKRTNFDNIKIMQHIMTDKKYIKPVFNYFCSLWKKNNIKELLEK